MIDTWARYELGSEIIECSVPLKWVCASLVSNCLVANLNGFEGTIGSGNIEIGVCVSHSRHIHQVAAVMAFRTRPIEMKACYR